MCRFAGRDRGGCPAVGIEGPGFPDVRGRGSVAEAVAPCQWLQAQRRGRDRHQWIQVGASAPQPPVQAHPGAAMVATLQRAEHAPARHAPSRRHGGPHRLVGRAQTARVIDRYHRLARNGSGERHHPVRGREHPLSGGTGQIHPAVSWQPVVLRIVEAPHHRRTRTQGPVEGVVRRGRSGRRHRGGQHEPAEDDPAQRDPAANGSARVEPVERDPAANGSARVEPAGRDPVRDAPGRRGPMHVHQRRIGRSAMESRSRRVWMTRGGVNSRLFPRGTRFRSDPSPP